MPLFRSLPPPEAVGNLIRELTCMVEMLYPDSSPLEENSVRTLTFMASRGIYRCTGDVISGTLACAVLLSFLISRHDTPIYVFLVWAIWVAAYLIGNQGD